MQVTEAIPKYADVFPFDAFNRMQRAALPAILETDENIVVGAPTASGKTALAELAICQTLERGGTSLFLAPLRALTNEKESEWERFERLGYSVYVVTGERDLNPRRAERADILVMTPEKADSATRKHETPRYGFIADIDCCVIDEVHLLDSEKRGAVLEVTISRLRRLCAPRVVALSATMPNVEDIADWLDAPGENTFQFGEEYRPVPLESTVETYAHGENPFADKYRRLYRAIDLAQPHVEADGQALVFVASRQDTVRAAEKAREVVEERGIVTGARGEYDRHLDAQAIQNETLQQSVVDGIGFHHAGLAREDKNAVEDWFKKGAIQLLFSTSTLAWGVNLPARCVVLRDTKLHDPLEGEVDMSPLDVLQMLGRAGRPGYDDAGYAHVVCDGADAAKYRDLLAEGKEIESRLAGELDAHLNAEIALGTLRDLEDVMDWLETTFYYVRARSAPDQYPSSGRLRERVRQTLETLVEEGFVQTEGERLGLEPTTLGRLASTFYMRLDTAREFAELAAQAAGAADGDDRPVDEAAILFTVARAGEFDSVSARRDGREAIRKVLGEEGNTLAPGQRKVLAILRGSMVSNIPSELTSDAWVIRQNALRLLAALQAYLQELGSAVAANLACRVEARVEHGVASEAVGLTAVDGVGAGRARKLATEGFETPRDIHGAGVDGLVEAGMSEGVAERLVQNAAALPTLAVEWGRFPETIDRGENELREVTVSADGDGALARVQALVEGREMTATTCYLGQRTMPVGVFGGDRASMEYVIRVIFPELPIPPLSERRVVDVQS